MYKPKLPIDIDRLKWIGPDDPGCTDSGLIHCVRIPETASRTQPAPMVVMLHGWSGDESVMWVFKHSLPPNVAVITPRAPLELTNGGFVWFEETHLNPALESQKLALNKLEHFLTCLPRLYPVNPTQMVLIGFSQGAMLGNAFTLTHPNNVIGVASLVGAMLQMPAIERHAGLLAGLPVFVAHGVRDDIIPVSAAQYTRDVYVQLGADVTYVEYPVAHKMNPQGMKDLKTWLYSARSQSNILKARE